MEKVYLLLGGNLGKRQLLIKQMRDVIQLNIGNITRCSSLYESEPWGFSHSNQFINQVVECYTNLDPLQLLKIIHDIERSLGRVRTDNGYAARTADIDILFYGNLIEISEVLTIPHPLLHKRRFTLLPLVELEPTMIHPQLNKTLTELLETCNDNSKVAIVNKVEVIEQ
jgi:2-amino-4-hydroxy-6-hydroxymethyldihydropteridine pyrophosphokinase